MSWGVSVFGVANIIDALSEIRAEWGGDAVYLVANNAEYAIHLETGTSKMPPYPFAKPAVEDYRRDPAAFVARNTDVDLSSLSSMDSLVKTVALAMQRQMMVNVNANNDSRGPSGRRSPGTDGAHPKVETGNLINSFRVERIR